MRYNNSFSVLKNGYQIVYKSSLGQYNALDIKMLCDKMAFVLLKLWVIRFGLVISGTLVTFGNLRTYCSVFAMLGCESLME